MKTKDVVPTELSSIQVTVTLRGGQGDMSYLMSFPAESVARIKLADGDYIAKVANATFKLALEKCFTHIDFYTPWHTYVAGDNDE